MGVRNKRTITMNIGFNGIRYYSDVGKRPIGISRTRRQEGKYILLVHPQKSLCVTLKPRRRVYLIFKNRLGSCRNFYLQS